MQLLVLADADGTPEKKVVWNADRVVRGRHPTTLPLEPVPANYPNETTLLLYINQMTVAVHIIESRKINGSKCGLRVLIVIIVY